VWLRYAECLNALEHKLDAIAAYEKVIDLVPNHFSARVSLSALHQQLGRPDDALRALLPRPLGLFVKLSVKKIGSWQKMFNNCVCEPLLHRIR